MELTYSLTADEFWQYNKLMIRKTPALWPRWIISALVIPLFFFYALWTTGVLPSTTGDLVWLILSVFWLLFFPWNMKRLSLRRAQQSPATLGLSSLQISPIALVSGTELIQTRFLWKAIVRVWDSPVGVLFFAAKLHAIIVPTSAFTRSGQKEQFVQLATAYWRHAHYGDPLPELPPSGPDTSVWPPPPRTQLQT